MSVELICARENGRNIVENLFPYYLYDLATVMQWPTQTSGTYKMNPNLLDEYWQDPHNHPYLITSDSEVAGFSLLRRYPGDVTTNDIGQFFVLRKFKGQGVGRQAFRQSVTRFPGAWLTRVLMENTSALRFWLAAIDELAQGHYTHATEIDIDLPMHFIRYHIGSR